MKISHLLRKLRFTIPAAALLLSAGCVGSTRSNGATSTLADARSHFAGFGTNKVHYLTVGTGRNTIVLIHCWAGNSGLWREQVPALAGRARLLLIDLPGHGQSDKPRTNYSMDFFASAVLAVMRDAHVARATLVGHSMGTPVICRVYKQAPEKVAALVAVDGTLRRPQLPPERSGQIIEAFRAPEYRENTRLIMGSMFPIPGTEALRDRVVSELLATPQYVMLGAMEGMFDADQPDWDVRKVTVPVLVINAPNPMWTDESKEHARSLSTRTDYRTIEGVGHWLMLEKPAEFNATLIDILEKFDLIAR
jgi:pimeloyl-ACP methyl ester carboxylesterase